jgi:hypothetical protein
MSRAAHIGTAQREKWEVVKKTGAFSRVFGFS